MSAIPAELNFATPWRRALPALLLLWAAVLLLYLDTAVAMVQIWARSDTFAHAFLVPPISLWLAWRRREWLARIEPRPQPWLLLPMAAIGVLWLLGELVSVNAATQFSLVAMLVLAVPTVLGLRAARELMFPLAFLFFAVPIGEFMTPMMISWTADATITALRFSGIPVYREGMQFVIPSGAWSVIEACSGVRYLIASFMVGTLFAYLNYRSTRRRVIFTGVSILVPIVANWLRAYMIVMLGHLSGNTIAVGVDHLIYGWVFFGVVIMIMFLIGARWAEPDEAVAPAAPMPARPGAAWRQPGTTAWSGTVLAAVLVVLLPQLANAALQRAPIAAAPQLVLPQQLGQWRAEDAQVAAWRPKLTNPSIEAHRTYTLNGSSVGVHIAYFRGQGPHSKLVNSQNVLVDSLDRDWNQVSSGVRSLRSPSRVVDLRTAKLLGSSTHGADRPELTVWRTYWVDGTLVAGDAAAKLHGAMARLRGRGDDGAWIVLFADEGSPQASDDALAAFATANVGLLEELLRQTRDAR